MSSHHVVRDEQEPALLVLEARLLRIETIAALLEWSPTIVVPFLEVEELSSMGIKPDIVIADREEAALLERWPNFFPLTILSPENGSNLLTALQYLSLRGHGAVNVLSGAWETIVPQASSWPEGLDIVLYSGSSRLLWRPGGTYRKWLAAGSKLKLHRFEKGASWVIEKLDGKTGRLDSAGEAKILTDEDGTITISSDAPFFVEEFL